MFVGPFPYLALNCIRIPKYTYGAVVNQFCWTDFSFGCIAVLCLWSLLMQKQEYRCIQNILLCGCLSCFVLPSLKSLLFRPSSSMLHLEAIVKHGWRLAKIGFTVLFVIYLFSGLYALVEVKTFFSSHRAGRQL